MKNIIVDVNRQFKFYIGIIVKIIRCKIIRLIDLFGRKLTTQRRELEIFENLHISSIHLTSNNLKSEFNQLLNNPLMAESIPN